MGLLFIDLHEANKVIDENIFDKLTDLKDVFFEHLSEPNIFGMYPKSKLLVVETALTIAKNEILLKKDELRKYISDRMFV